jgi:hypothetical protein
MERGSDKHGPRVDEEMEHETRSIEQGGAVEAHVEEEHEHEPAADREPIPDERIRGGRETGALTRDELEARSNLARSVEPSAFPGDRDALLASAQEEQADDSVLELLRQLPPGRQFETVQEVWAVLGGRTERERA